MIGLKDDGYESLRSKLRTMSDKDLIQFGLAARERCKDRQNQEAWEELRRLPITSGRSGARQKRLS